MKEKMEVQEIVVDGMTYVPKRSINQPAEKRDGMPYVLIRTYSAGVHCGYLKERKGKEVTLLDSIKNLEMEWGSFIVSACNGRDQQSF